MEPSGQVQTGRDMWSDLSDIWLKIKLDLNHHEPDSDYSFSNHGIVVWNEFMWNRGLKFMCCGRSDLDSYWNTNWIELNWINLNWRGWRWISIIDIDMDRCFGIGILKIYEWIDGFIGLLEIRKEMTYVCVVCGHMSIFMDTCFHFYYYHLRWYCLLLLLMTIESTSTLTFLVVHVKVVHYQWWMVVDPILIIVDRFDNCIFGFCIIENVYSSFFVDLA